MNCLTSSVEVLRANLMLVYSLCSSLTVSWMVGLLSPVEISQEFSSARLALSRHCFLLCCRSLQSTSNLAGLPLSDLVLNSRTRASTLRASAFL